MSDVVLPRTKDLPLSRGRTITIREELNHGEHVAMYARMSRENPADGKTRVDPLRFGDALIVAYLVDWNLTDTSGRRLEIRGLDADALQAILNNLRQRVIVEIKDAIQAHHDAQEATDDDLKKTESSGEPSLAILQSVG